MELVSEGVRERRRRLPSVLRSRFEFGFRCLALAGCVAVLLAVALVVFPGVAPAQDEVRVIKVSAGHSPGDKDPIYHRRLLFFVFSHDLAPEHPWGGSMTTLKDGKVQKMIGTGLRGSVFHVEYTEGIVQSETLTFSYTNPTNRSKLRTTSGVDVESFTLDLSPPTAKRSRVRDSLLEIHFDKTVRGTPVPATATFSVTADGNEVDVSAVAIKGSVVTLTLAAAVNQGETVKVGYTMPADDLDYLMPVDKRLQGTVRTVVPSFTDLGVTNTSAGPTVTAAAMVSTPSFDTDGDNTADTYGPGETIRVRLTFSEAVDVDTSGGVPSVKIRMDPDHDGVAATYENHTLTAVNFIYTVAEPDVSTAGIAVLEDTLTLNGGTIRAAAGSKTHAWIRHDGIAHDAGHKVNWLEGVPRPTVDTVAIESTPSFDTDGDNTADTYGPGETIRVRLTFSEAVNVGTSGGVPSVKIRMDPDHDGVAATYENHTLTEVDFVHTVVEPDISTAGIAVLEDTLALNGGTIRAATEPRGPALLSHDGIAPDAGHKVNWLEGVPRPTVETVAIESTPSFDTDGDDTTDTYGPGETIRVRLTFSEAVDVDTSGGMPSVKIRMDPDHDGVAATYESHTLTAVDFIHTVAEPNVSTAGIAVIEDSLALNGGTIRAATEPRGPALLNHDGIAPDAGHKVNWLEGVPHPTVAPLAIVSTPSFDTDGDDIADTYGPGETIRIRLTFSEVVEVDTSGGVPSLRIRMDPGYGGFAATYESHELTELYFVHTVAEPNISTAGIAVLEDSLALNGGTIRAAGSQVDAWLGHSGVTHDAGHKVDWRRGVTPPPRPQQTPDDRPRFGAVSVGPLALVAGEAMAPVVLPAASGGNGALSYSVTSRPAGLAGLSFDPATRRLSGTPGSEGRYVFVYRAEDADSNRGVSDTAELTFVVTVEPPRIALLRTAVTRTLAAVARRTLSSALSNIGARFAASVPGTGLTLAGRRLPLAAAGTVGMDGAAGTCSGAPRGHSPSAGTDVCVPAGMRSGGMTAEELLRSSAFTLGPGAGAGSGESGPAARWALWGRGDFGSFEGRPDEGSRYEGETRSGWLGVDARAGRWVAGVAFSHARGEADYGFEESEVSGGGRLETRLNALYPYGRWTFNDSTELRGVVGAGMGEARHIPEDGEEEASDLTMWMASAGVRRALAGAGGFELATRADASLARLDTGSGPQDIAGLSADAWRMRLGLETSRRFALGGERALTLLVEAAGRRDGGEGLTGAGLEVAGGVRYEAPGLRVEARGRWLAMHAQEGAREHGVSVTVRMGPGADGRGLSLMLTPRWGTPAGGAVAMWRDDMPRPSGPGAETLEARVGYGVGLARPSGVLTPFAETALGDDRRLRLGTRFAASRADLDVELAGERRESGAGEPVHGVGLDLKYRF